jgi:ectoine hydroxylase-related dioxygenase (phytanoyl-CoA dioxygenase family)
MSAAPAANRHAFLHDGYVEEYREKGYAIVRGVFSADEIAELRLAFERTYAEGMSHHATWRHQNRVMWVQEHETVGRYVSGCQWQSWVDPVLDRVRSDPRMLAILEPLIGRDIKQIINQMHWKTPGTGQTWGLHQDVRSRTPAHCFRNLGDAYVQTGLAIDRHWAGNGAMKVMPFSHQRGNLNMDGGVSHHRDTRENAVAAAGFDPAKLVDVVMEPGDVALWGPYMIHGGGINTTADNARRLYINGYVRAADCDRSQPVFEGGRPVPLTIPALVQYDQLYSRPEPHYPSDRASLVQRD